MSDYTTIPLSQKSKYAGQFETIISIEDAEYVQQFNWKIMRIRGKVKYARLRTNGKDIMLHRIILARKLERDELLPSEHVDHINGNGLDNRRENLRLATKSQNAANRPMFSNNKSGYKGIYKKRKRWCAKITLNKKIIHIGMYDTPEQAYEAYCKKAIELFGEFARLE